MISVIIPLYNNEKYIGACLESLQAQTYTNWEAIVVDDGSTDDSYNVAKSYSKADCRISVIRQENKRVGAARNNGLKLCGGNLLAFMDSDDLLEPNAFEEAVAVMEENSADMVQWEAHFFQNNEADVYDYAKESKPKREHCQIVADAEEGFHVLLDEKGIGSDSRYRMLRNSCRCVWTKLCRHHVFEGVWFPEDREYEDDFIVHKLFLNSNRTVFINDELTNKRNHATSVLHTMSLKGEFDHIECQKKRMIEAEKHGADNARLGQHAYFVSLLNLYIYCAGIKDKESEKVIISDFRNGFIEHSKFLSKIDLVIMNLFRVTPTIGGGIYSMYRRAKG